MAKGTRANPYDISIYELPPGAYECQSCCEKTDFGNHDFDDSSVLLMKCDATSNGGNGKKCGAWHRFTYYEPESKRTDEEDEE